MWLPFQSLAFILILATLSCGLPQPSGSPASSCSVIEEGSKVKKPCQFPFTFNNRVFTACTNFTDPDGKNW